MVWDLLEMMTHPPWMLPSASFGLTATAPYARCGTVPPFHRCARCCCLVYQSMLPDLASQDLLTYTLPSYRECWT